jgi:transcriptional regulator with XRE-family HTH domain
MHHFVQYIEVHISSKWIEHPGMDLRDIFAANLRRLRNESGLSQDDLAYDAQVSRGYLSQLETGVFYASLKIVGRLADALHVEPAEFLRLPKDKGKHRK